MSFPLLGETLGLYGKVSDDCCILPTIGTVLSVLGRLIVVALTLEPDFLPEGLEMLSADSFNAPNSGETFTDAAAVGVVLVVGDVVCDEVAVVLDVAVDVWLDVAVLV